MDNLGYLGIFIALLGLAGALWGGLKYRRARTASEAAQRWLSAPGRIISSDVALRGSGVSSSRYAYFVPVIRYGYTIAGREREGAMLRFGSPSSRTRAGAMAMIAPYPVGADIQVRYDPDNPDQSVLEPGNVGSNLLVTAIACAALLVVGIAIVVMAIRGAFSVDLSGRWHVRFDAGGVVYEGDLDAEHARGPLVLSFTDPDGVKRITEDCTLTRHQQRVSVTCVNPRVLSGTGGYSPDNFDLVFQGASRMSGTVSSPNGSAGTATFTRP